MKPCRLAAALTFSVLPGLAAAQATPGLYISLGAGVDFLQNEIVEPYSGNGPSKRQYTFNPGPTGEAALGFGFENGLRLEVEGNYGAARLNSAKFSNGTPGEATGHEPQFGGFVNLAYDFNLGLPFVPYLGVGAGYQALELDHVASNHAGLPLSSNLAPTEGAFAYQGIAGLSYPVLAIPGLSLTAEYHLLGVITPPPFRRGAADAFSTDGTVPQDYATLNNIFNHEALIGLRYSFGAPPASQPPPPPPSEAPAPPATRTYLVFFDWDRADLTERARQIVAEAAAASAKVPVTRIDVNGYTDLSGSADYNQRLSVRRAESVEAELVRDGVSRNEIVIRGFGETNPLVPTAPGVREPQNRRVEIVIH